VSPLVDHGSTFVDALHAHPPETRRAVALARAGPKSRRKSSCARGAFLNGRWTYINRGGELWEGYRGRLRGGNALAQKPQQTCLDYGLQKPSVPFERAPRQSASLKRTIEQHSVPWSMPSAEPKEKNASLGIRQPFVHKEQMRPWRSILTIEVNGVSATCGRPALNAVIAVIRLGAI
jgi:hypothetical protein